MRHDRKVNIVEADCSSMFTFVSCKNEAFKNKNDNDKMYRL